MIYSYKGVDPYSSHYKIAWLIKNYNQKSSVLDVGCNAGFIGRALRGINWQGYIAGIDKEKIFKQKVFSSGYNSFFPINVENGLGKFRRKFDIIVFADVLEHLIDPQRALKRIKKNIKKDGLVIISLPNIANIYIRLNLFLGNFDYSNRGILDKDHKLFYTKKTAVSLIKNSGLKIIQFDFTPIPLSVINKNFTYGKKYFPFYSLLNTISKIRPSFFSYQLIFVCRY